MDCPENVITPYIERDSSIGVLDEYDPLYPITSNAWLRINGSQEIGHVEGLYMDPLDSLLLESGWVVNLRIFVVQGNAPGVLVDKNGDNIIDSKDAALANYTLLSEEKRITLRIAFNDFYGHQVDLDNNGYCGAVPPPAARADWQESHFSKEIMVVGKVVWLFTALPE